MTRRCRKLVSGLAVVLLVLAIAMPMYAQNNTAFQYFYNNTGQLIKVIDSSSNEIDYTYDAVGNILQITRGTAPGGLAILNFTPQQGPIGMAVTIQGQGFSSNLSSNTVQFNGTPATVTSASTTTLVAIVPSGATTGPISVAVGSSRATSTTNFTVLQVPVITSVSPSQVLVNTNYPLQVTGVNLTGSTFVFVPVFSYPTITVATSSINGAGTAATLNLRISGGPTGTYVLVATNSNGPSSTVPSPGNSLQVELQDTTPPAVSITSPLPGTQFIQGQQIAVMVNATDSDGGGGLTQVGVTANGTGVGSLINPPYDFSYTASTVSTVTFVATARDAVGYLGTSSPVAVTVIADPLTTVTGTVVDTNNNPVSGATVTALGGLHSTTSANGTFSIPGVSTIQGNVNVTATFTTSNGTPLTGTSAFLPPVRGGTTNVGTITVEPPETKVLVATGLDNTGSFTNTSEVFDRSLGTWTQVQNEIPNIPPPGENQLYPGFCGSNMTRLSNGQVLFAGGGCADGGITTNAASLYDPGANQWASVTPMNFGRDQFGMVTLNTGNALAFAGCAGNCNGPNSQGQYLAQVGPSAEIYDPSSKVWTTVAMLNAAFGFFGFGNFVQPAARLIDGRVLACDNNGGGCEIYDPVANQWSNTAPLNDSPAQFVLLLTGSVLEVNNGGLGSVLFDPFSNSWGATGSLLSQQSFATLTLLSDGRVLASGGYNNNTGAVVPTAEIYDPTTGTWSATGQMNVARYYHVSVLLDDGRVLVAGGLDQNLNIFSSAEIYDPSSGTWTLTGSMSQPRGAANAVGLPATPAGTGAVGGQVTYADGSIASNILVTLLSIDSSGVSARSARTDAAGNYIFGDVPILNAFTVRAYTPDGGSYVDSASTTLSTNGQQATVNLTLPALATVQVTVFQANGSPFAGAQIEIQTSSHQFFRPVGTTNSNGILSIPYVPQGSFTVEALVTPSLTLIGTVSGTVTGGDQGQTIPVTISDPGTTVTGTVVDMNNNPVAGAMVALNSGPTGTTLNDGTFSILNAPTVFGNITATANATINGVPMRGSSAATPPVRGGVTNVGTIVVVPIGCGPTTVYENGPINGNANAWTVNSGYTVANSFVAVQSNLTSFQLGVWEFPGDQMLAVDWSITDAPFGGNVYGMGTAVVNDAFLFVNQDGFEVHMIFAPNVMVTLGLGNTYYLNLQNATTFLGNPIYWDQNSGVGCHSTGCPSLADDSLFGNIPSEAFQVCN